MKYSETDLTEAAKVISYLRSVRVYAVILLCAGLLYPALKIWAGANGAELYLLYCFTGILTLGSLSIIIRLNRRTAFFYGTSSVLAGIIYLFSILYFRGKIQSFFMIPGVILGIMMVRQGIFAAFGRRSQEAFSAANQGKISFINDLLKSLRNSPPNEDTINCVCDDNGKKRDLSIKFTDDMACFLLKGQHTPIFAERKNVYISELQGGPAFLNVSITLYNNEWLEAEFTKDAFRKYQRWKEL
jgi:hypothetical protein